MIVKIDATALAKSSCFLRFKYMVLDGYCDKQLTSDLVYGSAFHKFAEVLPLTNGNQHLAMMAGHKLFKEASPTFIVKDKKEWLDIVHLTGTMGNYIDKYGLNDEKNNCETIRVPELVCPICKGKGTILLPPPPNYIEGQTYRAVEKCSICNGLCILKNAPLVEQTFSIPFTRIGDIEFLLCGTMDCIVKFRDGCVAIKDYKTRGRQDASNYFPKYKLHPQLITYYYAFLKLAKLFPQSIFAELLSKSGRIGAFIEGVFMNSKETQFLKSPVMFFDDKQVEEYEHGVYMLCQRIAAYLRGEYKLYREGVVNNSCEWCAYKGVCSAVDDIAREQMLENFFRKREYNPLNLHGDGE